MRLVEIYNAPKRDGNDRDYYMKSNFQQSPEARSGFVLFTVMGLILFVVLVAGLFLYTARNHTHSVRRWYASDQCLLDAQSALELIKYEIVQTYASNGQASLAWFQSWSSNAIGNSPVYTIPALAPINGSTIRVTITNVSVIIASGYAEVDLVGTATRSAPYPVTRTITESLRMTAASGATNTPTVQPFEYAYLLNSSGRLQADMIINGDIRVNGNLGLNNSSIVNGQRYASGKITATAPTWTVKKYWNTADDQARPTDPTANDNIEWPMGYVPDKTKNSFMSEFTIPPIDDINALAAKVGGKISQQGKEIVVNTYAGAGPDGRAGTADDNCLILDGSSAPITIQGSVVVKGDLIIKGTINGQGTLYAGRNVHIVGNLSYVKPPAWPKPDNNPEQTAKNNAQADLLVLAAKGNIVVGNYTTATWSNRVWKIMTGSAVPYSVSASDAALGYDSDNKPANGYLFNGSYYLNEANGGRRLSGVGTNTLPRKYFESSLGNAAFSALCDANNVPRIDAALLSDHALIGNLGSSAKNGNTLLNGAVACRDDLSAFYGDFTINWDIRLGSSSKDYIGMTYITDTGDAQSESRTIGWREIH